MIKIKSEIKFVVSLIPKMESVEVNATKITPKSR